MDLGAALAVVGAKSAIAMMNAAPRDRPIGFIMGAGVDPPLLIVQMGNPDSVPNYRAVLRLFAYMMCKDEMLTQCRPNGVLIG